MLDEQLPDMNVVFEIQVETGRKVRARDNCIEVRSEGIGNGQFVRREEMSLDKVAEARPSLEKFRNGHGGLARGVKGRFSNMDLAILDDREGAERGGGQVGGGPGAGEGEQVEGDVLLPT